MATYSVKKKDDKYVIYEDDHIFTTPLGNQVTTLYKSIADRILLDIDRYGTDFHSADSILSWHFTTIDSFAPMSHNRVEQILASSFLKTVDWTCREYHGSAWLNYFGKWEDRHDLILKWLHNATIMQMTAACCIGNAYHSLNLALTLAAIMERDAGNARAESFSNLAHIIEDNTLYGSYSDLINDFQTFELYYGIHLEQNGPILGDILDDVLGDEEDNLEDYDVDDLTEHVVTIELLIGRNYYHYTNSQKDELQPLSYNLTDFDLDVSEKEVEEEDDDEDQDESSEDLSDYLPEDCWIKRFVDDDDPNTYYLLYLVVDEEGRITESGCLEETTQRIGGSSFFIMIPGMDLPGVKSYDYNSYPPENVVDDLHMLFSGRTLPLDFTFTNKRLPQKMIDEGGNGGSDTEYTYALQSAYRLAYMHMSIDTTEDGIIEGFNYSSYQSSGSGYGDMFSRSVLYSDRCDEAIDMLLYIYDKYTGEELEQMN